MIHYFSLPGLSNCCLYLFRLISYTWPTSPKETQRKREKERDLKHSLHTGSYNGDYDDEDDDEDHYKGLSSVKKSKKYVQTSSLFWS